MSIRATQRRFSFKPSPEPWPPEWARLPNLDTLEAISRGEVQPDPVEPTPERDQSKAARLRRLLGIDGVVTADSLPPGPRYCERNG